MSCHYEKISEVTNMLKVDILAQEHIVTGFVDCGHLLIVSPCLADSRNIYQKHLTW